MLYDFNQDRLSRGYWPTVVASACLGLFALLAWIIFFWSQHHKSWASSSGDQVQTIRVIGTAIAFTYFSISIKFETFVRKHAQLWSTLLLILASGVLSAITIFAFELAGNDSFTESSGARMGTAILIVTLVTYCSSNLSVWVIALSYVFPASCVVFYNGFQQEAGFVANVSFVHYFATVNVTGFILYFHRKRQDLALFKQRRKTAEVLTDLEKSESRERENSAAKTRLIAAVSHDLRQPLNSLGLYNNLLKTRFGGESNLALNAITEKVEECVSAMEGNLTRLQELAQLQSRANSVPLAPCSLAGIFTSLQAVFQPIADAAGVRFIVRFSDLHGSSLVTNSERLFEILANLLSNAIKFSKPIETRKPWVLLRASRERNDDSKGDLRIDVIDNGPGIHKDFHEKIFDEYVQLGNPQRQSSLGYGLGLSVVKELCNAMTGHRIALRSDLNRGARFSIFVPTALIDSDPSRNRPPQFADESKARQHPRHFADPNSSKLKGTSVVLVEDDEFLRRAISAQLEEDGAQVRSFPSARHAMAATANDVDAPTCLISDYWLPEPNDGIKTIELLRVQFGATLPALLISATSDLDPKKISEVPNLVFALKPVSAATLVSFIQKHSNKSS
jgi:signal transduction histidine kinase/CheY-like chemotaxis protein